MSLLNPALLWALVPLLGVPLFIHLLNKRFPKKLEFSSVENLRKTAAERSRLHRWRHRILTAVRTLLALLLLLVFLKPVLDRYGNAVRKGGGRRVLVLVDGSLSMEHRSGGLTARARAGIEAGKILGALQSGDRVNVIGVGRQPSVCFPGFMEDAGQARKFIEGMAAGVGRADFTQAVLAAARLLESGEGTAEIYVISDFQRKNWARVDFSPVDQRARLFFVDVAAAGARNRGILGVEPGQSRVLAGDTVPLEVTVGNFGPDLLRETVTVRVDNQVELQQAVEVAPWSSAVVTVPVPATAPGMRVCEVRLPEDDLALDDRWVLTLPVLEKEEILTVSAEGDVAKDPVRFLHAALNPFPGRAGSLLPRHVVSSQLDAPALASTRKVFITRSGALSEGSAEALARYLHRGGAVVWFLDGESDAANLERLAKASGERFIPVRLGALRKAERVGTGAQQVATGDFKSRYLRLFRGALRQDLGLLEFYDFHTASATGDGKVLLRFGDETPAVALGEHGLGTLLLMNFSVSELSSNLARQRIFPAWIQDLVKQLDLTEPPPVAYVAGQSVEAEVWKDDLRRGQITSPSGRVVEAAQEVLGERALIRFAAEEPGFYRLPGAKGEALWAVNPDPEESDLRPVDPSQLPVQEGTGGKFVGGDAEYREVASGTPLIQWLVLGALAVLGLEMALQMTFRRVSA